MKRASFSFGAVVATIGTILIACGIAWLLAQNWHQIPSPAKIAILAALTSAAFITGTALRMKDYAKIGAALLVLGSLLYTLSIFLIAQIFHTDTTAQGVAWLLLLCWVGVSAAAYIFNSPPSLIVGLIEVIIWLGVQFTALVTNLQEFPAGMLALSFLGMGIVFYGLRLIHKKHQFAKLYLWWSVLYLLIFTYILSFQTFLALLWPAGISATAKISVFVASLIVIGVAAIAVGSRKNKENRVELFGFCTAIVVFAALIFSSSIASGIIGTCMEKYCYDYKDQESCESATPAFDSPLGLACVWNQGNCMAQDCYTYKEPQACEKTGCRWASSSQESYCRGLNCEEIYTQETCESRTYCAWSENACQPKYCEMHQTKGECDNAKENLYCSWSDQYRMCTRYSKCQENAQKKQCDQFTECRWQVGPAGIRGKSVPTKVWALWIAYNIFFMLLILSVIGLGSAMKSGSLINLGIIFFSLDIISRYIGFMMDYWGYTSLSILFITGGVLLLVGGWLIEKWRRKLVARTRKKK